MKKILIAEDNDSNYILMTYILKKRYEYDRARNGQEAVEMVKNGDLGIPVPDYVDENVSDKVVKIIQSYVGVVNKMVWRKF